MAALEGIRNPSLVAKAVMDFEQLALTHDLNLSFSPSTETLKVWGNAEQLAQVRLAALRNCNEFLAAVANFHD